MKFGEAVHGECASYVFVTSAAPRSACLTWDVGAGIRGAVFPGTLRICVPVS